MTPASEAGQSANAAPCLGPNPTLTLPPPGAPADVACVALSANFLVAGTASGGLWYFRCAERVPVAEARHAGGVWRVWPQPAGVRRASLAFSEANKRVNYRGASQMCLSCKDLAAIYLSATLTAPRAHGAFGCCRQESCACSKRGDRLVCSRART